MASERAVYVITSGSYSDYHICTVFSTKELADAWLAEANKGAKSGPYEIEVWPLDVSAGEVRRKRYEATIDLETGEIFEQREWDWLATPEARTDEPEFRDFKHQKPSMGVLCFGRISVKVASYVDAEHAQKLAAEYRQEWQRSAAAAPKKEGQ